MLTGGGRFAGDLSLPGQTYAYLLRSPHAHARIASIDIGAAGEMSGVIAVLTGSNAESDGLQPVPYRPVPENPYEEPLKSRDGAPFFVAPHPVLAVGKVRHVGEAVATCEDAASGGADPLDRVDFAPSFCQSSAPMLVGSTFAHSQRWHRSGCGHIILRRRESRRR